MLAQYQSVTLSLVCHRGSTTIIPLSGAEFTDRSATCQGPVRVKKTTANTAVMSMRRLRLTRCVSLTR
jgi:hypothetical protein